MTIDYNAWRFWIGVGQIAFNLIVVVWLWNNRKHRATNDKVAQVGLRVDQTEKDLLKIQTELQHLPQCSHHHELDKRMAAVQGSVKKIEGRIEGFGHGLDIIQEHLLNRGT